ncbi:hypothetical protein [Chondromyces apiculatus]|uniref:Cytochrome c domain-containing protein n=1 Tax=Chondromyces apiculatus DSM 436 TaxID=1192034 RepID=A0A017SVD1_9BACT|nr:hypothetical protein [Chondromyces apiculatus]EYF00722.1 Hypothetical protein CAP_0290 [Chondromyces apiculatus DSM 436]
MPSRSERRYSTLRMTSRNLSRRPWIALAWAALTLTAAACSDGAGQDGDEPGFTNLSGATCPPDSTLTYDTFGRPFMEAYCTSCHSAHLTGAQRQGAPTDHNFDTLEACHEAGADHIDQTTAAGPDRVNDSMPPIYPAPSEAERRQLGEWLACGMP